MIVDKQEEFNGHIKAIFRGGKINKINWGEDSSEENGWNSWSQQQQLEYAKELAAAMNQAAESLQTERNELLTKVDEAEARSVNAQQAVDIQKSIVFQQLTAGNAEVQELSTKIQKLESELKMARALLEK